MDAEEQARIFAQYELSRHPKSLTLTKTSSYSKVQAYTKGCIHKYELNLYRGIKYFLLDLQTILDFDPESANQVFKEHKSLIRYSYSPKGQQKEFEGKKLENAILAQCRRCGQFSKPYKYCGTCEDVQYCSDTCEVNVKITHLKEECKIRPYPRIQHGTMMEVHFGSRQGHNVEVYCQNAMRSSSIKRGLTILKDIHRNLVERQTSAMAIDSLKSREEKYEIVLNEKQRSLLLNMKNEKEYATGVLKVDIESLEDVGLIYEQNQMLEQVELLLAERGGVVIERVEEIHNNHIQYVYLFWLP